jgi:hypothetical protein
MTMISNNSSSYDNESCPDSDSDRAAAAPLDPALAGMSDRFFTSLREETYRAVRPTERDMLAIPWGPRLDVIFDPKGAPGMLGGRVRIMARTSGTEVEIANVPILSADQPITVTASQACDQYVIKASLGSDPGLQARRVESYFFARVFSATR